jgi:hypothetical protein
MKKTNYLSNAKNRTCLPFFLLKTFEFDSCTGNHSSPVILLQHLPKPTIE